MGYKILPVLILSIFMVSGCYESRVALSEAPSYSIDQDLTGHWIAQGDSAKDPVLKLVVMPFDQKQYLISWQDSDELLICRGFVSKLKQMKIMNVQNVMSIEKKERTFVFFEYSLSDKDTLIVKMISDETKALKNKLFNTSSELAEALEKAGKSGLVFEDPIIFKRTESFRLEVK